MSDEPKIIDPANPPKVEYVIPLWMRNEQIKLAIARNVPRIDGRDEKDMRQEPIALVSYGPSLNDTWTGIKEFKYVMSCSGAHPFLIERGIIPTWHVAVDPLPKNTVRLIGTPHSDVEYLIASTCHQDVFDHLEGFNVKLWHVFDAEEDALRTLPHGEWALTGGCSVGVRMLTMARFLGFTDLHVYGMDGSEGDSGKHAGPHPSQPKGHSLVTIHGRTFKTTSSMFSVAQGIWHELNQMPGVKATFYGDGMIQHMAKFYEPKYVEQERAIIGFNKPELISEDYKQLNRQLHHDNVAYGVGGKRHAKVVMEMAEKTDCRSILDYGCGKGYLAKEIPFPIWEYDPAVPGKDEAPKPADLVVCTDVLEHIEPDKILYVLKDLQRVTKKLGYFTIHTGAASKVLPDGRNTHLIQQGKQWWKNRLSLFFDVQTMIPKGPELHVVVTKKTAKVEKHAEATPIMESVLVA